MFFGEVVAHEMLWLLLIVGGSMLLFSYLKPGFPRQLFYLIIGILLATLGFKIPSEAEILSALAIIFMLFSAELPGHNVPHFFRSIVRHLPVAIVAAIGPWCGAFFFSQLWGWGFNESLILGAVFAATALPFTLGVLRELKLENSPAAHIAIAASTTDAILATLVGVFTSLFIGVSIGEHDGHFAIEIGKTAAFFAFIFLLHFIFVKGKILKKLHGDILSLLVIGGVIIAIGEGIFGLHYAIGALLAGVLLQEEIFSKTSTKFVDSAEKISNSTFFISPFFFIYLGLNLDLKTVFSDITILLAGGGLFLSVALFQFTAAYFSSSLRGLSKTDASCFGFAMLPRDVVAIVIFEMSSVHISSEYADLIFSSVILAIFLLNCAATIGLNIVKYVKVKNGIMEK